VNVNAPALERSTLPAVTAPPSTTKAPPGNAFGRSTGQAGFDPAFDFDNNGTINALDYGQFRSRFGKVFVH
jgi:hypothetical protein